ncbi:MAG: Zn-dependent hydrolase, partial [Firmicutes bacterium]|nr:Zn-dependent hydrolase [Bacillota bacterium]
METSLERIRRDMLNISRFNATPHKGCTRFSYSEEDRKAKEYLIEEFNRLGLKVSIDAIGNIRARLEGKDAQAPAVMSGSHIDTVLHGGNFDGVVGVVGALEAVRVLVENKINVRNPVEIIVFVEEEGSNFGVTTVGSQAITGRYKLEHIKKLKTNGGVSLYEMAKNYGLDPDNLEESVIKPDEIKALIELHIEQGGILDSAALPIGIVGAISGIKTVAVTFEGVSNHAGATPMLLRKDPMIGAAKMIIAVEDIVKNRAHTSTVGTVGRITCFPNIPNIIAGNVTCT